ncbi:hypothetical protein [uncultured Staphylococcus sp.]|uniref:hypothetical protein n=1 Tax=uncultured Staphylococcus sp. TaxID=189668 RepID=UPI0025EE8B8B|nr:hypothetical protein [uncultured Staphylococcus sp.]
MYTTQDIEEMINHYHSNCNLLQELLPDLDSNSIAQYGIEATLPKPQGVNTSKVENKCISRYKITDRHRKLIERINFINSAQESIEDDRLYFLLELWKKGKRRREILDIMRINRNEYNRMRREIVNIAYASQK